MPDNGVKKFVPLIAIVMVGLLFSTSCSASRLEDLFNRKKRQMTQAENERTRMSALNHFSYALIHVQEGRSDLALKELDRAIDSDPDSAYLREIKAYLLFQKGKYDEAIESADEALDIEPERAFAYNVKGMAHKAREEYEKAEQAFMKAVEHEPDEQEYILNLADVRLRQGQAKQALSTLQWYSERHPEDLDVRYYIATIHISMGQARMGEEILKRIVEADPRHYPALKDLFQMKAGRGQWDQAVKYGSILLSYYPSDSESRMMMMDVLLRKGDHGRALQVLEAGKRVGVPDPQWWIRKGFLYLSLRETEKSRQEFEGALALDRSSSEATFGLGLAALQAGDKKEAAAYFDSIPEDSEAYVDAQRQLAAIAVQNRDPHGALEIMENVLEKAPHSVQAVISYAAVARQAGEFEKAENALKNALDKNPGDEDLLYELGMTYYFQGDVEKSLDTMHEVLNRNPNSARTLNFIGYTWAEEGRNLDQAEKYIKKALELEPGAGYIMDSLGWVYFQRGEYEKAMQWLQEALEKAGPDAEILEHIGDTYLKLGNRDKAIESYERALDYLMLERVRKRIEGKLEDLK